MKLITLLLALNALTAIQLVAADCSKDVVKECLTNTRNLINGCEDGNLACKCPNYNALVACYNGCENETDLGQQKIVESEYLANCKTFEDNLKSQSSSTTKSTSATTSSYSSPTSTGTTNSKNNAAASNIDGSMFSNSLLTGAAAVAGVIAYYI
jgi:hypothetical protein